MNLGYIGLGKMGANMVGRLLEKKHNVVVFDTNKDAIHMVKQHGAESADSLERLAFSLSSPRLFWVMVPHRAVDIVLAQLLPHVQKGDIVIDGGNSPYKESMRRGKELEEKGVGFLDVGVSGGPAGAKYGACLMIGGKKELYERYEKLFADIAAPDAYGYMGASGAGHFVKMVHNGIEYGMMQAIAEGFAVMKQSEFNVDLEKIADVYNHESVIASRLVGWLKKAFAQYGESLDAISGSASHSGEGMWTVETARELGIPVPVIERALQFRVDSAVHPSYTGKVVSALRNQFGGHDVKLS